MLPFLTPKFIKQAKLYIKGAEKRIAYHKDQWSEETLAKFEGCIQKLKGAVKSKDKGEIKLIEEELDNLCSSHCPAPKDAWLSENVEVFLVAIVIALGIRTYILQPFTIPTASMSPTLYGIRGKETKQEPPNILMRIVDFATKGRSYFNVIAKDDETIVEVKESKSFVLFTRTTLKTDKGNTYTIGESASALIPEFFPRGIVNSSYKKGEAIAQGYTDTGDHVFVDKMSYHFRKPTRGEVFVFTTQTITGISSQFTQYYIKRLTGLPGDALRIDAPHLYVNGKIAEEPGMKRVMEGSFPTHDSYQGYGNGTENGHMLVPRDYVINVPEKGYFAMGDNSYNSSDSRVWGHVPEENLVGVAVFVYWPFLREKETHFGLIK